MLYLIYGNDWQKARAKAREILDSLQKKKPDAAVVHVEEGEVSEEKLEELCGSQGLFERKFIVFADRVCTDIENIEIIDKKMEVIARSENVFIFLENELKVTILKSFEKHATKVQEFKKLEKKERFNSFLLADALGEKNKERLWVLYQKALDEGLSPEELHGTLFWQIKVLRSAGLVKSPEEAGLKPFTWNKAKRHLVKWEPEELRNLSNRMVSVYHEARMGKFQLETALERLILDL